MFLIPIGILALFLYSFLQAYGFPTLSWVLVAILAILAGIGEGRMR